MGLPLVQTCGRSYQQEEAYIPLACHLEVHILGEAYHKLEVAFHKVEEFILGTFLELAFRRLVVAFILEDTGLVVDSKVPVLAYTLFF